MITFLMVLYTSRLVNSFKWYKFIGTDIYAAAWAFVILVIANIATKDGAYSDWRIYALAFFNSFLVAASAGKLRDKSLDEANKSQEKKQKAESNTKTNEKSQSEAV